MLSIFDIKKELGDNIYIHPVHPNSIKSNSIDLHASQFAWSIKTKGPLARKNSQLIIPAHDTALVYTQESVYLSEKIGGSIHSKVTLVSLGFGHIGTTFDSRYIGNLLIALHNNSDHELPLVIGQEFVTLQLNYLHTPSYGGQDNDPGHPRMLNGFDEKSVEKYISWRDKNRWNTDVVTLYDTMLSSEAYKRCKDDYKRELKKFSKEKLVNNVKKLAKVSIILFIILLFPTIFAYMVDLGKASNVIARICECFLFPAVAAIFAALIVHEFLDER